MKSAPLRRFSEAGSDPGFRLDVLRGLAARPRRIPSKYLYDRAGSALFERICATPEYYLTRTEIELVRTHAEAISHSLGEGVQLIEYGSGAGIKTQLLLSALQQPRRFVPVEISATALSESCEVLAREFPGLDIWPLRADFTALSALPPSCAVTSQRVVYLAGSTLGNFDESQSRTLLGDMRRIAGPEGALLIGLDLKKDPVQIEAAYNDAEGVTAAFTLNLLERINRELGADFDPAGFEHVARYVPMRGRIETRIVSRRAQQVHLEGRIVSFADADAIEVEISRKFDALDIARMAAAASLRVERTWTDARGWFALVLMRPAMPA